MCGIIGYTGAKNAVEVGVDGLKRMEYRGYDSAGFAVFTSDGGAVRRRVVGRVGGLDEFTDHDARFGIFHTRWATHGQPTEGNAHPHADCRGELFVVHNGIIENYQELREELREDGHRFVSETDTEVLPHLIERELENVEEQDAGQRLRLAVVRALAHVRGTYGISVIWSHAPGYIVAARNSSPLLLGVGEGEMIAASDASAVIPHTKRVVYLEDNDVALLWPDGYEITSFGMSVEERQENTIEWDVEDAQKGGYAHFMLKEIHEQPDAVRDAVRGRSILDEGRAKLGGLESVEEKLRSIDRLILVACGTASYATLVGEYMIEEYAGISVEVEVGSEFRYRKPIIDDRTALIAVSQSGETADTLAAVKEAKRKGALTIGIVNTVGSTIARETDAGVYNHAGPEIAVASTKAFTSQLSILALLTVFLGRQRSMSATMGKRILEELAVIPDKIECVIAMEEQIKDIADRYAHYDNMFYIGRKYNFPVALEGALKMKEISYIHAEGYSSGEMKHGPIALIDEQMPTVAIVPSDSVYEKGISNIQEIRARCGPILAIATEGDEAIASMADDVLFIPKTLEMLTPLLVTVPLQLLAYYVALARGCDIDKPRNLAKSVTVE